MYGRAAVGWWQAGTDEGRSDPDVVLGCAGDISTLETVERPVQTGDHVTIVVSRGSPRTEKRSRQKASFEWPFAAAAGSFGSSLSRQPVSPIQTSALPRWTLVSSKVET